MNFLSILRCAENLGDTLVVHLQKMNPDQEIRYSRNITLPEIGKVGQEKLLNSKVLVVGAGGLGSPLLLYLSAAGIGTIGVVDDDYITLSNLQRQVLYETCDVGQPKAASARDALLDLNPDINIVCHQVRLDASNIGSISTNYDIIVDGSDNFETRFLINEHCYKSKKTLISAAIYGFTGQLSTFKAHVGQENPCYLCLYPEIPTKDAVSNCSDSGVLGGVAGVMGSLQSIEVVKELLNIGESLSGYLIVFDAINNIHNKIKIIRNQNCLCCGV